MQRSSLVQQLLYGFFVLIALVVLLDFILPGTVVQDEVVRVQSEVQQHNNASGNSHYSYKIFTSQHQFSVSEAFAVAADETDEIAYTVSNIFSEINRYRLLKGELSGVYSLRIMSGLVVPILSILSLVLSFAYKMKLDTLVFVLQVLLVADVIYLIQ